LEKRCEAFYKLKRRKWRYNVILAPEEAWKLFSFDHLRSRPDHFSARGGGMTNDRIASHDVLRAKDLAPENV
jgi:hypothetical protein